MTSFSSTERYSASAERPKASAENRAAVAATLSATNFTNTPEDYIGMEALEGPYGDKQVCWQNMP